MGHASLRDKRLIETMGLFFMSKIIKGADNSWERKIGISMK
jgi:hypothetical protein